MKETQREKIGSFNSKLESFLIKQTLKNEKIEDIEKKAADLNNAIESIYRQNYGIVFSGEINDRDIVHKKLIKRFNLDKSLEGKNIKQLKGLLDKENSKLIAIYKVNGDSSKKQSLLKKEIVFYTGIGNKYEGGANYIGLTTGEIRGKIQELCSTMSIEEIFKYTKNINKRIDGNLRRSKMVDQSNLKVINALYDYSFSRLKKENATNKEFIAFIKLITGRGKLRLGKGEIYEGKQNFDYENINVDEEFKAQMIANKALIYIMYKKGGLLEEMKEKQQISVQLEDEELDGKTPSAILGETKKFFNNSADNLKPGYGDEMLQKLGYAQTLAKPYNDLNFNEKITIGSLARLLKEIKKLDKKQLSDQKYLENVSKKMVKKSFEDLNENFSDNFNETWTDWNGTSAEDLGIYGVKAEIFQLYQDINGNQGLFDWKDENELGLGTIVFGITMVTALIVLGPIFAAGAAAYTFKIGLIAGAKIGLAGGLSGQIFSRKGYDSYLEGVIDVGSKVASETIITALMTASGGLLLQKMGLKLVTQPSGIKILTESGKAFSPDLFFSKAAYTKAGLTDKTVILLEMFAIMVATGKIDSEIKNHFIENHIDKDLLN